MKSMNSVTKQDIINHINKMMEAEGYTDSDIIGSIFSTRGFESDVTHTVIVLNSEVDITEL